LQIGFRYRPPNNEALTDGRVAKKRIGGFDHVASKILVAKIVGVDRDVALLTAA
jgi:hypothetical protein